MSLLLQIIREPAGSWIVCGLADRPVAHLPSLAASVDYARRECAEASATIEFLIDGLYAVAHQQDGWPRRLVGPGDGPDTASEGTGTKGPPRSGDGATKRWERGEIDRCSKELPLQPSERHRPGSSRSEIARCD
jgi:hypothetical protein